MKTQAIGLALAVSLLCPSARGQWESIQVPDSTLDVNGGIALAMSGTSLFAGTPTRGIFRSTDDGTSWTAVNTGLPWHMFGGYYGAVSCFAVSDANLFAGGNDGVFLSSNNGTSWVAFSAGLPYVAGNDSSRWYSVYRLAASEMDLFAVTEEGVFLRASNSTRWTAVSGGLPRSPYDSTRYLGVSCLVFSGTNLFAGTGNGVYMSTNRGTTWTAVNEGLHSDVHDTTRYIPVVCLAVSGTNLFAGASWSTTEPSGGVFRSTNSGTTWTYVSSAFPYTRVNSLVVRGTNLFAGTGGRQVVTRRIGGPGVFLSTNNGTSWTSVNEGLPKHLPDDTTHYPEIGGLAVSGTYLFATFTYYAPGIFRRPLSEMITSTQSPSNQLPVAFTLFQNYPNPFNPSTTIKFELPEASHVKLEVFDILGRELAVLVNEMRNAGLYEVQFDGPNLASGVHFYRLTSGQFRAVKKMAVVR
jgi:hypothetical protein